MMEEEPTSGTVEEHPDGAQIVSQLQDAALTDVTQASEDQRKSHSPSPPVSSLPPPSQLPLSLGSPLGAGAASPMAALSSPQQKPFLPASVTTGQNSPIMFSTPSTLAKPASREATPTEAPPPAYTPPASGPAPPTSFVPLDPAPPSPQGETIGPVYPSPGEQKQGGGGLFGWLGGGLVNKMVEKTKTGMESVITTLDPGMKDVIYSGGEIDLVVASDKEVKVGAVRDAFQEVFGHATITGMAIQPSSVAPQPVGFTAGLKGCEERLEALRQKPEIQDETVVLAVENFIAELLPDKWFDMGCILLRDRSRGVELSAYTQAVPVPPALVARAHDATPHDYPARWSGLKLTVGQCYAEDAAARGEQVSASDWHAAETGISRRDMICAAAKAVAGMYKRRLDH